MRDQTIAHKADKANIGRSDRQAFLLYRSLVFILGKKSFFLAAEGKVRYDQTKSIVDIIVNHGVQGCTNGTDEIYFWQPGT